MGLFRVCYLYFFMMLHIILDLQTLKSGLFIDCQHDLFNQVIIESNLVEIKKKFIHIQIFSGSRVKIRMNIASTI